MSSPTSPKKVSMIGGTRVARLAAGVRRETCAQESWATSKQNRQALNCERKRHQTTSAKENIELQIIDPGIG
jgi:hypothetical protein